MPEVGDLKRGFEIGFNNRHWYIYIKCENCSNERYVQSVGGKAKNKLCADCSHNKFGQILKAKYRGNANG
jgi:uncharacterized Zn finger protein